MELIMSSVLMDIKKGRGKPRVPNNNVVALKEPIKLGEETFTDLPKIKVRVRSIHGLYKDNEPLKEKDHKFIYDLLQVFNKKEEKAGEIKNIVIAPHKTKSYYRTFFSVYNDDSRDEFSVQKCVEKIQLMNARSSKDKKGRGRK